MFWSPFPPLCSLRLLINTFGWLIDLLPLSFSLSFSRSLSILFCPLSSSSALILIPPLHRIFFCLFFTLFATFLRVQSLPPTSHLPPILNRYIPPTTTVLPASARSSCKFCHRQRSMLSGSDHCMSLDETNHSQPLSIHNCNHKNLSWYNKDSTDVTNPRPT